MKDSVSNFRVAYTSSPLAGTFQNEISGFFLPSCSSTMDIGREFLSKTDVLSSDFCFTRMPQDTKSGILVFSGEQTRGRGRRERGWVSAADGGMYLTLVDRMPRTRSALSGLSLAIGLSIYESLKAMGVGAALKWPNDILTRSFPHKKLSGILLETFPAGVPEECYVLSGIGVNINQESFPEEVPATSVRLETGNLLPYAETCMTIASSVLSSYKKFMEEGFSPFQSPWWNSSLHHNSRVRCEVPHLDGVVEGISSDGSLLVRAQRRLHTIVSGDITLTHEFESTGELGRVDEGEGI